MTTESKKRHAGRVSDLVRQVYAAYVSKDRQLVESLLSDDFRFSSPYDDRIGRQRYFEKCWPNNERIRGIDIKKIVENGNDAFVIYELETNSGDRFRNVEYFVFDGDEIRQIKVYSGDSPAGTTKESG